MTDPALKPVRANPLAGWRVWGPFEWVCVPGALVFVHSLTRDAVNVTVRVRGRTHWVTAGVRGEGVPLPGTPAVFQADGAYPHGPNPFAVGRVLFAEGDPAFPDPLAAAGPLPRQCLLCAAPARDGGPTCGHRGCPPDHAAALAEYERWLHSIAEMIR